MHHSWLNTPWKRPDTLVSLSRNMNLIGFLIAVVLIITIGTGCPPLNTDSQDLLKEIMKSDGCRGCESCAPEEGEGEGEGELPAEGEGEIISEGEAEVEGEAPAEGEGELPPEGETPVEGEGEVLPEGETPPEGEGESGPVLDCPPDTVFAQPVTEVGGTFYASTSLDGALPLENLIVDLGADLLDADDDVYLLNSVYEAHWWGVEFDSSGFPCEGEVGNYAVSIYRWNQALQLYEAVCEWNSLSPERIPANFSVSGSSGELPVFSYTATLDPPCESLTGEPVYINIRRIMAGEGEQEECRFGWVTTDNGVEQDFLLVGTPEPVVIEGNLAFCLVGATPRDEGESVALVSISAGTFQMGRTYDWSSIWEPEDQIEGEATDELPVHSVYLNAYQIGKYEITNQEYCNVLDYALGKGYLKTFDGAPWTGAGEVYGGAYVYKLVDTVREECNIEYVAGVFTPKTRAGLPEDTKYSMADHPMVAVSWYGCAAFCNWLSEMEGLSPCYDMTQEDWPLKDSTTRGNGYRLPTEAEWERAAAWDGARHWMYAFSSDEIGGRARCNYTDGTTVNPLGLLDRCVTAPVGWFNGMNISPNGGILTVDTVSPAGAYDMSGNVWEWCQDWLSAYGASAQLNPKGPENGGVKVLRGGSFEDDFHFCRSANRESRGPDKTPYMRGFRVVRSWQ